MKNMQDTQNTQNMQSTQDQPKENLYGYLVVARYHDSIAVIGEVLSVDLYETSEDFDAGKNPIYVVKLLQDIDNSSNPAVLAAKAGDVIMVCASDITVKVPKHEVTGIIPEV